MSGPQISKYERGSADPPLSRVLQWAAIFGVPAAYFLGEIDLSDADLRGDRSDRYVEAVSRGAAVAAGSDPSVDVEMPVRGPRGYDPDEVEIPRGLEELIESGMVMTGGELRVLMGYVDPRAKTGGASGGAWRWPAEEWLRRLMDGRYERWAERLRRRQESGARTQDDGEANDPRSDGSTSHTEPHTG